MKKVKLVATLLFFAVCTLFATDQDSLLQVYQNSPFDTARIDAATELFVQTFRSDLPKAIRYNEFVVEKSADIDYLRGKMNGIYQKGILAYLKGDFPKAIRHYSKAESYARQLGNDPTRFTVMKANVYLVTGKLDTASLLFESAIERFEKVGDFHNGMVASNNLGVLYSNQGNYKKALAVYQKAKEYALAAKDSAHLASFAINIGNSYFDMGNDAQAIENLLFAVDISEKIKNYRAQSVALNTIGEQYLETDQPEKALFYLEKAEAIKRAFDYISSLGNTLISEGKAHFALNNAEKGLEKLNEAVKLFEASKEVRGLAFAYFARSKILLEQKKWDSGFADLQKAEKNAQQGQQKDLLSSIYLKYAEIINTDDFPTTTIQNVAAETALDQAEIYAKSTDNPKTLATTYRAQAKLYEQKKDFARAFSYAKKLQTISDTLYSSEQVRALEEMRTKYETTQKEQENELLLAKNELANRRNQLYLGGLIAVLFVSFLLGFLYLKLRKTTEELALQKQKVETQNLELRDLNQTKDRFFSIIAHDLRSPIAAFQGIGSQINYFVRKKAFDRLSELGDAINESSTQLNNLLDNLLHWAMSQTGKIPYRPQLLSAAAQIEEVTALLEGLSRSKNIQFEIKANPSEVIFADERAVNTILRNLLGNALKFSNEGSRIWIDTKSADHYTVIGIRDEGVGMTDDQLKRLFAVEKTSQKGTKGEQGTGLGLILVKELIDLNQGKITVTSKENQGTTFTVFLPKKV